ncbi:hypothetical protein ACFLQ3_02695 [Bacteroidota bacterium]
METIRRYFKFLLILSFGFIFQNINLFAQASTEDSILFTSDFFDSDEPLKISLEFNIKKYMNEKSDTVYLPAKLGYYISDTFKIEKEVRVKPRGISRLRHCHMPPIWLNIKKSNIKDDFISDSKKVKIVTLCRVNNEYTKYLLKEYLIYKLYNIITEKSFRVRLLKINYIDTGRKNKSNTHWAFMIEPENLLAERIEALPIKVDDLNYRHTDSTAADIMCFFQYMIGNTDFTVNGRHNVKLYKSKDHTKPLLIPIPYDFDFAGLISAEYANPADILDIERVAQRYFLGLCRSDSQYLKLMDLFEEKKDEMYGFVNSFEYLDERSRKVTLKYLDEFYDEMKHPKFIDKKLKRTCR